MRRERDARLTLAVMAAAVLAAPAAWSDTVDFDGETREIAARCGPAVVALTCQATLSQGGRRVPMAFYGTGVVVSEDGLVVTSTTVIPPDATAIQVWFRGGSVASAELVATDKETESAVVRATSDAKLVHVDLADSSKAWVGQRAYTFGNPFHVIEYDGQVATSVGVVSGIYEMVDNGDDSNQSTYASLVLETDAAVNPGSDGGPLLDERGRLIGVISLGFQRERGLGTAIPLHRIRERIEALRALEIHPTVQAGEGHPVGAAFAKAAARIAPAVVWMEIERAPEEPYKPERQPMTGLEMQEQALRKMMDRPDALATGIAIAGGEYILTSAFHVRHQKEAEWKEGDAPLIKKILVHAEGLAEPVEATVVARNDPYDVALLKPARKLPAAVELESWDNPRWGQFVAALGRHRGSEGVTLSTGILSAPERNHLLIRVHQTDAMMNYANLGGPVIDLTGNLAGIASFVNPESDLGLNSGVGVFTDVGTIRRILPDLEKGETTRKPPLPFLGVGAWMGDDPARGARVATIYKESAAFKAGVLPGDTILSVDRNPIGEWADLVRVITGKTIGQEIEFEVLRGEETHVLKATLGRRP
ncbi:MAG: trypsin-like peptidase domain-containing protein [Planctomycetes bacterium]|nr:trypsin-like peptidase domain-containing protein [Planctomycetota bacterium]